ncbi:hypothetical protein ACNHYB_00675 [Isoptericola jiangsuensis]|uniref:hypothetical protein n=1 Tax=Isoptericola jiangsuensis TaxID=548579 RepID=UPI003AAAA166
MASPARLEEPDDVDEDEWDEPEPSYTWLHYIILVVVAFVLGLLVWNLVIDRDDDFATEEAPAAMEIHTLPGAGTGDLR